MKLRTLLFLALIALASLAQAVDLSKSMILVARPELVDQVYGATILIVTPMGREQHAGFIVNRPGNMTLGQLFPNDRPLRKVVDPVYLGGPLSPQVVFALVQGKQSPGGSHSHRIPACPVHRGTRHVEER
jgi:putative AlgH/UPF0301 family transcriptional regulator